MIGDQNKGRLRPTLMRHESTGASSYSQGGEIETRLLVVGALLRSPIAVGAALAWGSHLLWDRGVGYGMRRADGTIIEPRRRTGSSSRFG